LAAALSAGMLASVSTLALPLSPTMTVAPAAARIWMILSRPVTSPPTLI